MPLLTQCNTPIGHHDTHFCHCLSGHEWVLNPFMTATTTTPKWWKLCRCRSSVNEPHTGGHQQQRQLYFPSWVFILGRRQWQWQHPNTYMLLLPLLLQKLVSNPFHDDIIAVAVDAPSSVNTPHWIPHNPFMTTKIRRWRCRCRHSVWTSLKTERFKSRLETVAVRSSCVVYVFKSVWVQGRWYNGKPFQRRIV